MSNEAFSKSVAPNNLVTQCRSASQRNSISPFNGNRRWFGHRFMPLTVACLVLATPLLAQVANPNWCRALPRPEYKTLERVPVSDAWFEVYKPARDVFAIYEPHQAEETIGYLIVGQKRALLFDTGMGISNVKKLTAELTKLPIIVLNSHTHDDHVGGNWEFDTVYGMDTDFTRQNARGSREDAQAEITPDQICGSLPRGFDAKAYATRPWKIAAYLHDGERFDLGGRTVEVIATPGHTPDAISLVDRANGLLFTGTLTIPHRSGSIVPRLMSTRMRLRSVASQPLPRRSSSFWARTTFRLRLPPC